MEDGVGLLFPNGDGGSPSFRGLLSTSNQLAIGSIPPKNWGVVQQRSSNWCEFYGKKP